MTNPNKRRTIAYRKLISAGATGAMFAAEVTGKSARGVLRWACTDHSGFSKAMGSMPSLGFIDSIKYMLFCVCYTMAYAIAMGVAAWFTIAVWIPFLFRVLFLY